ncbi:hypothetical protein ACFQZQ_10795 [Lysobacter koreensis]|uniref:Uncharacterized protein n=1 Tax=Lysobacter koreensis TaxID=266122 RepID=A0ABW2YR95_9GAMM
MERVVSLVATISAILLPIAVGYALRPTAEHSKHAMLWLLLTASALVVSGLLSAIAIRLGYSAFQDLPAPRPLHRKLELGVLALPPILFVAIIAWQVLSAGT